MVLSARRIGLALCALFALSTSAEAQTTQPRAIVVVIDSHTGMLGERMETAKRGAMYVAKTLKQTDRFALVSHGASKRLALLARYARRGASAMPASRRRESLRRLRRRLEMVKLPLASPNPKRLAGKLQRVFVGRNVGVEPGMAMAHYFLGAVTKKFRRRAILIWSSPDPMLPHWSVINDLHLLGIGITYISLDSSMRVTLPRGSIDRWYQVNAKTSLTDILRRELGPNPRAMRVLAFQHRRGLKRQLSVTKWWLTAQPCPRGASLSKRSGAGGRVFECRLANGIRHGRRTAWQADRKTLLSDATYGHGKHHGVRRRFRTSGALESMEEFRGGVRHGRQRAWAANGLLVSDITYRLGKRNGAGRQWNADGTLLAKTNHRDGKAVGTWRTIGSHDTFLQRYASDVADGHYVKKALGRVVIRGKFRQGRKVGIWRSWYPNGKKESVGAYRNNRRDGTWKFFTDKGELWRKQIYSNGVIVRTLWF